MKSHLQLLLILSYIYFTRTIGEAMSNIPFQGEPRTQLTSQPTGLEYGNNDTQENIMEVVPDTSPNTSEIDKVEKIQTVSYFDPPNSTRSPLPVLSDNFEVEANKNYSNVDEHILKMGVELDYSFSETVSSSDDPNMLISSPGCPPSEAIPFLQTHPYHRYVWLYYGKPPRCYKTGFQGPCPDGMSLGALFTSKYGSCSCSCFSAYGASEGKPKEDLVISPFMDQQRKFCSDKHSNYYTMHGNICYKLYTRGPCGENQQFVVSPVDNKAYCNVAKCSFNGDPKAWYEMWNGDCGRKANECYVIYRKHQVPVCMSCLYCYILPESHFPHMNTVVRGPYQSHYMLSYLSYNPTCDTKYEYSKTLKMCILKPPTRPVNVG